MDYPNFISQKYKAEFDEVRNLITSHDKHISKYNRVMNLYIINVVLSEIPMLLFTHKKLFLTAVWRIIDNIRTHKADQQYDDDYIIDKLNEALDLLLHGYKLSDQEYDAICNICSLPKNTEIEEFIKDGRTAYIASYLCRKLLPYWKDELTPECIEYVSAEIEKNIKETNEFIAKEEVLNAVYFIEPRPHNWREQLTDAGIPVDD